MKPKKEVVKIHTGKQLAMVAAVCLLFLTATTLASACDAGIGVVKTADPTTICDGDAVTYTYEVTNTGTVNLTGIVLDDDKLGTINCPKTELVPGESMTCTATTNLYIGNPWNDYAIVRNVVTVSGTGTTGEFVYRRDDATVTIWRCDREREEMRTIGFWKHQFAVATGNNKGHAQIDSTTLKSYLSIDVFGNTIETLDEGYGALWIKKAPMEDRAIQQCFGTLLNFANGAALESTPVDINYDKVLDTTFGDAMDDAENRFLSGDYEGAKDICDSINNMDE